MISFNQLKLEEKLGISKNSLEIQDYSYTKINNFKTEIPAYCIMIDTGML